MIYGDVFPTAQVFTTKALEQFLADTRIFRHPLDGGNQVSCGIINRMATITNMY